MGVGSRRQAPAALPPGKTRYPLYARQGGPQGRSGRVRKISPPSGFDPRTVQPIASRCTDWANPAHCNGNISDPNLRATQSLGVRIKDMVDFDHVNQTKTRHLMRRLTKNNTMCRRNKFILHNYISLVFKCVQIRMWLMQYTFIQRSYWTHSCSPSL